MVVVDMKKAKKRAFFSPKFGQNIAIISGLLNSLTL